MAADHDMAAADEVIDVEVEGDESILFAKVWDDKIADLLSKYPSPTAYLAEMMPSTKEKQCFVQWLWRNFQERDDTLYQRASPLPPVTEEQMAQTPPVALPIAALIFQDAASLKPAPGREHALDLIGMFLKDGFITSSDVLLVCQPRALLDAGSDLQAPWPKESVGDSLQAFSIGYIKGRTRQFVGFALCHVPSRRRGWHHGWLAEALLQAL